MITFFVSSTFRDMHGEREQLHNLVLPRIRDYAVKQGEYVDVRDLRWGVDAGEGNPDERLGRVVDVCLDAIDDCDGYLICLLGESYGTMLEGQQAQLLERIWEHRGRTPLGDASEAYAISLTQVELEYGLFEGDPSRCLCFRRVCPNLPDEFRTHPERQAALIGRIEADERIACGTYHCEWDASQGMSRNLEELSEQLFEGMRRIVDQKVGDRSDQNWADLELAEARAHADELHQSFAGRHALLQELDLLVDSHHTVAIYGDSGIGKSAFLATWIVGRRSETPAYDRYWYVSCGYGDRSKTVYDVLVQLLYFADLLISEYGPQSKSVDDGPGRVMPRSDLVSEAHAINVLKIHLETCDRVLKEAEKQAVIVVDAINQLIALDGESGLEWLGAEKLTNITVVVSAIERPFGFGDTLELKDLTRADVKEIIEHDLYLIGPRARSGLVEPICRKMGSIKPLYLRGVLDILKMHLSDAATDDRDVFKRSRDLIEKLGVTVEALVSDVFDHAFATVYRSSSAVSISQNEERLKPKSEMVAEQSYHHYLGLIARSGFGINDQNMAELLEANNVTWNEQLITYCRLRLHSFFRRDGEGRWAFSHDLVTSAVRKKVEESATHALLCQFGHRFELPDAGSKAPALVGSSDASATPKVTPTEARGLSLATQTLMFYDVVAAALHQGDHKLLGKLVCLANELESAEQEAYEAKQYQRHTYLWGLYSQSVDRAVREGGFLRWNLIGNYLELIQAWPKDVERMLTGALMQVNNQTDANRRIASMGPAQLFARDRVGHLDERPVDLSFCWFLKQLIDIHDDTSIRRETFDFVECSSDYLIGQRLDGRTEDDQFKLVAAANLDFFESNKIVKEGFDEEHEHDGFSLDGWEPHDPMVRRAWRVSGEMLAWYMREVEPLLKDASALDPYVLERCAAFTNNIGQRCNSMQLLDEGLAYRLKALALKATMLLQQLQLGEELVAKFQGLCIVPEEGLDHLRLAEAHGEFWDGVRGAMAPESVSDRDIADLWQSIATTYRAFGTDYYYRKTWSGYQVGCRYLELALRMMEDRNFALSGKERAVTCIRLAGMWAQYLGACVDRGVEELVGFDLKTLQRVFRQAVSYYKDHARFDRRENENLRKNIQAGTDALEAAYNVLEDAGMADAARFESARAALEELLSTFPEV